MLKKKISSLLLVICLIFGMFAGNTAALDTNMIYDDSSNEYYANFLSKLGIYALVNEDEVFYGDEKPVLRYEAAKSLITLLGYDLDGIKGIINHYFVDVPAFYSEAAVIAIAVDHGLMTGIGTNTFAPEGEMKVEHFLKSLVVALGYEHEAVLRGGYPHGYVTLANRFGLLKGVGCSVSDVLTREMMLKILCNALEVDICVPNAMEGENVTYRIEKGVTLLKYYHDITFVKDEIINSNQILSLKSHFEAKNDRVLIGDQIMYTEDSRVFEYAGYKANLYIREKDEVKTVVYFEIDEDNSVYAFSPKNVISADSEHIKYETEDSKDETVLIDSSAQIFLNGTLVNQDADKCMRDFTGSMTVIDNDDDGEADVVFIENCRYGKVDYVDGQKEVIYFEDNSISYADKKVAIKGLAENAEVTDLPTGTVVGVTDGENSDTVIINVIGNPVSVTVSEVSEDYITSASGETYLLSYELDKDDADLLKPLQNIAVAVNGMNEIVWISEETDAASVGFLIRVSTDKKGFNTKVALKILDTGNVVTLYEVKGDKLRIDGKSVKKEDVEEYLINSKNQLNITADGATSQVIYYVINDARELVSIYTAKTDESGKFMLSYNYKEDGKASLRDHGYRSAVFAYRNALTRDVPIFQVPLENLDSYEDKYFSVTTYTTSEFTDGGSFEFDSYITDEKDLIPEAVVYYKTAVPEISRDSGFFLVEKIVTAVDEDGSPVARVKGYYNDKEVSYFADPSFNLSFDGVESGDIITVALDVTNRIMDFELVYDLSTDTVNPEYVGTSIDDIVAVRVLHIYNAPQDSAFMKTYYGGFKDGVPGEENAVLFNLTPHTRTNTGVYSYDVEKEKGKLMQPDKIIDYCRDSENYTKIVVRYRKEYQLNAVFYH